MEEVLNLLMEAYNKFLELPIQHESDSIEFTDGIHKCQHILAIRVAREHRPDLFYNKMKGEPDANRLRDILRRARTI